MSAESGNGSGNSGIAAQPISIWLLLLLVFIVFDQTAVEFCLHRYCSHRQSQTSRFVNVLIFLHGSAAQQWAVGKHPPAPPQERDNFALRPEYVRDRIKPYPELLVLEALAILFLGQYLRAQFVSLVSHLANLTGWAGCIYNDTRKWDHILLATALLSSFTIRHLTWAVNSLMHRPSFWFFRFGGATTSSRNERCADWGVA